MFHSHRKVDDVCIAYNQLVMYVGIKNSIKNSCKSLMYSAVKTVIYKYSTLFFVICMHCYKLHNSNTNCNDDLQF